MKSSLLRAMILLPIAFSVGICHAVASFPEPSFRNDAVRIQYRKLSDRIQERFSKQISRFGVLEIDILDERIAQLRDLFLSLDNSVSQKDKRSTAQTIREIKKAVISLVAFLKDPSDLKLQHYRSMESPQPFGDSDGRKGESLSNTVDITYYSDDLEGNRTSNGDVFSQKVFSAAKCVTPLNRFIQVWRGDRSLIVEVNDRPNCTKFPNLIDLSTTAFDFLGERGIGKLPGEYFELATAPKSYSKQHLPYDAFSEQNITLDKRIPNSYLVNESVHIRGEISLESRSVTFEITEPSGASVRLERNVERVFDFSYPLTQKGEYSIRFDGSEQSVRIFVLDPALFAGKKLIDDPMEKLAEITARRERYENDDIGIRLVFEDGIYRIASLSDGKQTFTYSGLGDIIIPRDALQLLSAKENPDVVITASRTITDFSHDSFTNPVEIFRGSLIIRE